VRCPIFWKQHLFIGSGVIEAVMQDHHQVTTQTVGDVLDSVRCQLCRARVRDIQDKRIDWCLTIGHTDIQASWESEVKDGIGESGEERRNRGPRQIA
jgi:hypothetical protein